MRFLLQPNFKRPWILSSTYDLVSKLIVVLFGRRKDRGEILKLKTESVKMVGRLEVNGAARLTQISVKSETNVGQVFPS